MDVSALRRQYRQRRSREVLLFTRTGETGTGETGTASDRLSDAVSVVPVAQGSTSPWEPNSPSPPFSSNLKMFDPWHVHLDLHRRARLTAQGPPSSPETKTSRRSGSSSSEGFSSSQSGSSCSSRETSSSCISDPLRADPGSGSIRGSSEGCKKNQVQGTSKDPHHSSFRRTAEGSESHPQGPHQNQNHSAETSWSRQLLSPIPRICRQLSAGGLDPSSQNHYPFPSRKTPKISEAARRLGLYPSL
ncbi:uncharacterized protein LOC108229789 isoform X2 [Kryptolebias marmoratus]|uniref:uncharacterized protein LOC108229789 isoform X2 n=1 Tax=Kryptolebias marmoratus TaxID=37003 RepID=UPI000D530C28|nr:uncharacterized protein LOC108229789 isoform X2 [Kryptolebias marmoratus]